MIEVCSEGVSKELVSLEEITTRQEAMARCIGPLATLATIEIIDRAHARFGDSLATTLARSTLTRFGEEGIREMPLWCIGRSKNDAFLLSDIDGIIQPLQANLTFEQAIILNKYTYQRVLPLIVDESMRTTGTIIDEHALPGYFAAASVVEYGTGEEVRAAYKSASYARLGHYMKRDDFMDMLRSLSFTANGGLTNVYNTPSDTFARVQTRIRQALIPVQDPSLLQPIGLHELCVKKPEGTISLAPKVVKLLRTFMRLDNEFNIHNTQYDTTHGSIGCPASMKSVRVREDDFTDEQWSRLTEGENPVASYDPASKTLTMLRKPINELTKVYADAVAAFDNLTRQDDPSVKIS